MEFLNEAIGRIKVFFREVYESIDLLIEDVVLEVKYQWNCIPELYRILIKDGVKIVLYFAAGLLYMGLALNFFAYLVTP
jgi:tRNA A58 N-methylase Trm61